MNSVVIFAEIVQHYTAREHIAFVNSLLTLSRSHSRFVIVQSKLLKELYYVYVNEWHEPYMRNVRYDTHMPQRLVPTHVRELSINGFGKYNIDITPHLKKLSANNMILNINSGKIPDGLVEVNFNNVHFHNHKIVLPNSVKKLSLRDMYYRYVRHIEVEELTLTDVFGNDDIIPSSVTTLKVIRGYGVGMMRYQLSENITSLSIDDNNHILSCPPRVKILTLRGCNLLSNLPDTIEELYMRNVVGNILSIPRNVKHLDLENCVIDKQHHNKTLDKLRETFLPMSAEKVNIKNCLIQDISFFNELFSLYLGS